MMKYTHSNNFYIHKITRRSYIITQLDWITWLHLELEVQHYNSILGHTDTIKWGVMYVKFIIMYMRIDNTTAEKFMWYAYNYHLNIIL